VDQNRLTQRYSRPCSDLRPKLCLCQAFASDPPFLPLKSKRKSGIIGKG
jgi:hypothetical protein